MNKFVFELPCKTNVQNANICFGGKCFTFHITFVFISSNFFVLAISLNFSIPSSVEKPRLVFYLLAWWRIASILFNMTSLSVVFISSSEIWSAISCAGEQYVLLLFSYLLLFLVFEGLGIEFVHSISFLVL